MHAFPHILRRLGGFVGLGLLACGGDDLLLPSAGHPAELRLVSGDLQEAQTGARLPDPLVVEAVDAAGRPVVGSPIVFRFVASTAGAELSPDTAETNQSGRAVARVRLGQAPGAHPVEALVADGPDGLRVRFVLTALTPPPAPPGGGGGGSGGGGDDGGDDDDGGFGGGDGGGDEGGGGGGGDEEDDGDRRGGGGGGGDVDGGGGDDDDGRGDDDDDDDDDDDRERKGGKGKDDKGKGSDD